MKKEIFIMNYKSFIICPKCKAEYLPCEIFYPDNFLGKVKKIKKSSNGKIISFDDVILQNDELFICDYCETAFTVDVNFQFTTTKFQQCEEYKQKLKDK